MNISKLPRYDTHQGTINMIFESCNIGSVSIIRTLAGKTRANHYHPNDEHYILVTQGYLEIYERKVGDDKPENVTLTIVQVGDVHLTPKMTEHTMYFPEYCEFWCFSKLPRNSENYEAETVRFDKSLKEIYNEIPF